MRTANGGRAAVGTELCHVTTTKQERDNILRLEAAAKEYTKSLPRRRKPEHEKPGPVTWIQF